MVLVQPEEAASNPRPCDKPSIEMLFGRLRKRLAAGETKPSQAPMGFLVHNQRELDALMKVPWIPDRL